MPSQPVAGITLHLNFASQEMHAISVVKINWLKLFKGVKIAVCCEIHTKHTNTLCRQNEEFYFAKAGGTYSNHWALKRYV
jgi:hypothetical protein